MSRKLTEEQVQEKVTKAHGDMVSLVAGTFKDTHTIALFIDKELGEFWCRPHHVFRGHGHPKRGVMKNVAQRILPIQVIKERIFEMHGDQLVLDENTYVKLRKKARFVDIKNGEFWAVPADIINGHNGTRKTEKLIKTLTDRYGVINPSQRPDHFSKMKNLPPDWYRIPYWKTGKIVILSSFL